MVTEGAAQALLRRGAARELEPAEEKLMRMRLGASLPATGSLERAGRGFPETELDLLAYEVEAYLKLRDRRSRRTRAPAAKPVISRAKEKIIRALRKKGR